MTLAIRPEHPGDEPAIGEVTRQAFASHPYSHQTEHFIIEALRKAGALAVSLVAERDGRIVGHIAFSPVHIDDGSTGWYGLGPVAVLPECQRQGIGRALVEHGLAALQALGAQGCVLVGNPAFYGRFGFARATALQLPGVPPEFLLMLPLGAARAHGRVRFHAAFDATG